MFSEPDASGRCCPENMAPVPHAKEVSGMGRARCLQKYMDWVAKNIW